MEKWKSRRVPLFRFDVFLSVDHGKVENGNVEKWTSGKVQVKHGKMEKWKSGNVVVFNSSAFLFFRKWKSGKVEYGKVEKWKSRNVQVEL